MAVSRDEAERIYRQILEAVQMLGQNNPEGAEAICKAVLKEIPNHPDALKILGIIEGHRLNNDKAVDYFTRSLAFDPNQPQIWAYLGNALVYERDFERAGKALEKALQVDPNNAEARLWLAILSFGQGDKAGAEALLKEALQKNPQGGEAYYLLTKIKGYEFSTTEWNELLALAGSPGADGKDRVYANYALANASKARGDKDAFLSFLEIANSLQSQRAPAFDRTLFEVVQASKAAFTKEAFKNQSKVYKNAPTPVFILGLPRSGTTLLEDILACHSQIYGGDELLFVPSTIISGVEAATNQPYPQGVSALSPETWAGLGHAFSKRIAKISTGKPYVTDKLLTNIFQAGAIKMALPQAKFVFVGRNFLDTALSIYSNFFEDQMFYFSDFTKMAAHFRLVYEALAFWDTLLPGEIYKIQYEDVVRDPENETKNLLKFLGLEWQENCLEFYKSTRPVFTTSFSQIREPLNSASIGKWKEYAGLLEPFKAGVSDMIDAEGLLKREA